MWRYVYTRTLLSHSFYLLFILLSLIPFILLFCLYLRKKKKKKKKKKKVWREIFVILFFFLSLFVIPLYLFSSFSPSIQNIKVKRKRGKGG